MEKENISLEGLIKKISEKREEKKPKFWKEIERFLNYLENGKIKEVTFEDGTGIEKSETLGWMMFFPTNILTKDEGIKKVVQEVEIIEASPRKTYAFLKELEKKEIKEIY